LPERLLQRCHLLGALAHRVRQRGLDLRGV
jgi:hypothetical protein